MEQPKVGDGTSCDIPNAHRLVESSGHQEIRLWIEIDTEHKVSVSS